MQSRANHHNIIPFEVDAQGIQPEHFPQAEKPALIFHYSFHNFFKYLHLTSPEKPFTIKNGHAFKRIVFLHKTV